MSLVLLTLLLHASPGPEVRFTVRADRDRRSISPLIYGASAALELEQSRFGLLRFGGNRTTTYNWENNASNAGSDYQFQNDGYLSSSDVPGEAVKRWITQASSIRAATLITIPIVDWVAADQNGDGDVRESKDYLKTRFRRNRALKGAPLSAKPDPRDGFVNQDEFVSWLKAAEPQTQVLFSLDNEPELWSQTHPEVHPEPVGYEELCARNLTFARMIKRVWPAAKVTGFVSYGWNGLTTLQNARDREGDFTDHWLQKMKAGERAEGKRLIDYLDFHWYPEAKAGGVRITEASSSPAVIAARVQAPRSLWDPTYRESSWIADAVGQPLRLLPRLKEKIAAHYPGTQLAITEWNFGGGGHISGAIATADALGIFGREGVGLAAFWDLNPDESYALAAIRAYRNYDGRQSTFRDTSISATTSDPTATSIYASLDAAHPERVVLIAINKTPGTVRAALTLTHPTGFSRLEAFVLEGTQAQLIRAGDISASGANEFLVWLPPFSVSVLAPR